MTMRGWRSAATLALAWMVAGMGGVDGARACEKPPATSPASAHVAPAVTPAPTPASAQAAPAAHAVPAGPELLGVPSPRETAVPAAAVTPAPAAAPSAPAPTRVVVPLPAERIVVRVGELSDLGDLSDLSEGGETIDLTDLSALGEALSGDAAALTDDVSELVKQSEAIDRAREALERSTEWLAGGTTTSTKSTTSTRASARAARHEHVNVRRNGWDEDEEHNEVRTDTTITVRRGMVFALENFGGSIDLKTWSKNAVRVRAMHGRRSWVSLNSGGGRLDVSSQAKLGPPGAVDYEITMPRWMNAKLSGVYNDVTADGLEGGMTVETVSGDIRATRVAGDIALRSVQGTVIVEGAKGSLQLSSVNDGVRVVNADGPIAAEAVNGDIQLVDLRSRMVEATTVSGEVVYDGTIVDGGDYRFSTHNGDIALAMPDASNATVSVATFSGEFASAFRVPMKKINKDKRFRMVFGSGSAKVNLESFDGAIQLFKPGEKLFKVYTMSEWLERGKDHEKKKQEKLLRRAAEQDQDDADDEEDGE
jgi:hypothetical protein